MRNFIKINSTIIIVFLLLTGTTFADSLQSWYQPAPNTTWFWQLTGKVKINNNAKIYDIDLEETPQKTIDALHKKGKKVICYFSAGSFENYRNDAKDFPKKSLGKKLDGWAEEKWLDIANYQDFSHIMEARLDMAVKKNCDGVEPDNVDAYSNKNGFRITYQDQLKYNKWLAKEAHNRNLSIALKNNLDQVKDLVNDFDFAINEQCFEYKECEKLIPFIEQGKAVLGVEYRGNKKAICKKSKELEFSWIKTNSNLNGKNVFNCLQ